MPFEQSRVSRFTRLPPGAGVGATEARGGGRRGGDGQDRRASPLRVGPKLPAAVREGRRFFLRAFLAGFRDQVHAARRP
jgi:hypothetical protein